MASSPGTYTPKRHYRSFGSQRWAVKRVVVALGVMTILLSFIAAKPVESEEKPRLNSDQIQQRFGSYVVEVLWQNDMRRLANLYSQHSTDRDDVRICRTLALTQFELPVAPELVEADKAIRAGASIGATLRAAGWRVIKSDAAFATASAGKQFSALSADTVAVGEALALQVYSLQVSDGSNRHAYAVIAEAYHPEHIPANHEWQQSAGPIDQVLESLSGTRKDALSALVNALN